MHRPARLGWVAVGLMPPHFHQQCRMGNGPPCAAMQTSYVGTQLEHHSAARTLLWASGAGGAQRVRDAGWLMPPAARGGRSSGGACAGGRGRRSLRCVPPPLSLDAASRARAASTHRQCGAHGRRPARGAGAARPGHAWPLLPLPPAREQRQQRRRQRQQQQRCAGRPPPCMGAVHVRSAGHQCASARGLHRTQRVPCPPRWVAPAARIIMHASMALHGMPKCSRPGAVPRRAVPR